MSVLHPIAGAEALAPAEQLVSIVLTTLNAATYLRQAVDSCLQQTHGNLELIAVDGGSTDGTQGILEAVQDPRLRLVHQERNAGKLPGAINLGLSQAGGEYLTWMQADSTYTPDAIERMLGALERNPAAGQVYADYCEIDAHGRVTRAVELPDPDSFLDATGDPAGCCFLIRRSVREAVGQHDVGTFPSHDFDYRMRIALRFGSVHIREPLYYWRYHAGSLTGRFGWAALARQCIEIRVALGLDTTLQARRRLAQVEMALAFEMYSQGQWKGVPRQVRQGLGLHPGFWRNPGVWSILLKSLARSVAARKQPGEYAES